MLIPFIWVALFSAAVVSVHAALLARSPNPGEHRKNFGCHRARHAGFRRHPRSRGSGLRSTGRGKRSDG